MSPSALADLSRAELAVLGREYLLAGHLIDRAGMPHVIAEFGREAMRDVAIDEWMGASPVYTRRIRRLLGIDGDDVTAIFKGLQFDIGAPHQFMDFRYRVDDARRGEFWLASCGALMDVEPMGDEFVVAMCHHIEDPTFDATATATNARARMRPVHRPPRTPADRHPHCHWVVDIADDRAALPEPAVAVRIAESRAAAMPLPTTDASDGYGGPFDPELRLERFSADTLRALLDEFCLQGHLLARSFMLAVQDRFGVDTALRLGAKQLTGIAGLTAKRLARMLGERATLPAVLALHPALRPHPYVHVRIDGSRLELLECDALAEGDDLTWPALLVHHDARALEAIAHAVDPRARVERIGERVWQTTTDAAADPAPELAEVVLASFTTGADFTFRTP